MIQKTEIGDGRLRLSRRHHFLPEMAIRVEGLDVN
jgi:hypothetical protein